MKKKKKLSEWFLEGLRDKTGEIKVMKEFTFVFVFFLHYILLSYTKAYFYFLNHMALEFTQKVWLNSKSEKDHCDSQNNLKYYKLQICIHGGKGAKRL